MSELFFIGTGGSVATEERDNTSFLLQTEGNLILIDCPGSVIQKLKKLNFDPRAVDALLITHIHPDHIYGLPSLVHSLMLEECLIDIYGSKETIGFCKDLLDLFDLRSETIKCRLNMVSADSRESRQLSPSLRCSFLDVPHSPASMALHFNLEAEGLHFIYSGDTPAYPELFQQAKGIDCLVHDCSAPSRFFEIYPSLRSMHTDALTLGVLAHEAGVKHLIPCHFFGELDFSLSEIEEEIRRNFRGELTIPEDFSRISLFKKEHKS